MKAWPKENRVKARQLRENNLSIGEISKKLKIPKTTLHYWISDLKRPTYITREDKLRHLALIRPLAAQAHQKMREARLTVIRKKVFSDNSQYKLGDKKLLRAMLSMLYWAEGRKGRGGVNFANTDPGLSLLFITLMRKVYKLDENKFRVRLHLHSYHNIQKSIKFWSNLLMISEAKFGKIYIKPRSKTRKFRENFAGICFIVYHDDALRYEILETAYTLANKISQAPVA